MSDDDELVFPGYSTMTRKEFRASEKEGQKWVAQRKYRSVTSFPSFSRPVALRLDAFAKCVQKGDFHETAISVKRNGFHIVCENWEDGSVVYTTKNGFPLTAEGANGGLKKTLAMIETHLSITMADMFNPALVKFDDENISSHPEDEDQRACTKLHLEFCVRRKGEKSDDLCALMHGKWASNPNAYDVHVVVFDIEVRDDDNEGNLPFWDRYGMMSAAFPDHVVRLLYGADEVIDTLSTMEGIVAYTLRNAPMKVKAQHPIPMRILAVKKTTTEFVGYDTFLVGMHAGGNEYRVLHEVSMGELFTDATRSEQKKCFLNPLYFKVGKDKVTGKAKTVTTSRSVIAPMVCKLNDEVMRAPRVEGRVLSKTKAMLSDGTRLLIDNSRSFAFDDKFEFVRINVVLSPNELWRLQSGDIHLQAASILAVGEFGTAEHRSLLGMDFPLSKLERVTDKRLCQNPLELYRFVFGREVDPFADLRQSYATYAKAVRAYRETRDEIMAGLRAPVGQE